MAISVNPPPLLKIPKKFLEDREVRSFIEQQNTIIFQLWNRTGANVDLVSEGTEGVAENTANILINSGLIADNSSAIGTNSGLISDNTDDIGDNAVDILTNSGLISDNADAIVDNTDLININSGLINDIPIYSGFMAQLQSLQRKLEGTPEFTIDTSGFSTDLTFITTDKVIA